MKVKNSARKQHIQLVNRTAEQLQGIHQPPRGWISLVRHALGMSGRHVANRMGVTRNAVYQAERNELDGAITVAQMRKLAHAMDAEFVYAIVPRKPVDDLIRAQAIRKAQARVRRAGSHMALESQALTEEQTSQRIDELADDLVRNPPPDFWEVE